MDGAMRHQLLSDAQLEAELSALETEMPVLHSRNQNVYALASAWADRHDAIVAATPVDLLTFVEERLRRIGIRWGLMHGPRTTTQFYALPPEEADISL